MAIASFILGLISLIASIVPFLGIFAISNLTSLR